jgi:hypothetical protein
MPDIHQAAFDAANAARDAAQAAQARADALSGAQLEVERRQHEVSDRRDQIDALPADTDELQRYRLEIAFGIGLKRLGWAQEALATIEQEHNEL